MRKPSRYPQMQPFTTRIFLTGMLAFSHLLLTCSNIQAQGVTDKSREHYFPYVVDGQLSDGTEYRTRLVLTADITTICSVVSTVPGVSIMPLLFRDIRGSVSLTLPHSPRTSPALRSGRASVVCGAPVAAYIVYSLLSPTGDVLSEVTAFSSPPVVTAQFVVHQGGGKVAVAIANPTNSPIEYLIRAVNWETNTEVARATISIDGQSRFGKFLEEFLTLPQGFAGEVFITAIGVDFTIDPIVSAVALNFKGTIFSLVPITSSSR